MARKVTEADSVTLSRQKQEAHQFNSGHAKRYVQSLKIATVVTHLKCYQFRSSLANVVTIQLVRNLLKKLKRKEFYFILQPNGSS